METVVRTVGILLLIGVLMLGILTYSNVVGISDSLDWIKERVGRLVDWFIPKKTNVTIVVGDYPGVSATVNNNKVVITANLSAGATYTDLVKIKVVSDKEATLVVRVVNGLGIELPFTVTATNAIIDSGSFTVGAGATATQKITIYPYGEATVEVSLSLTPTANIEGTIAIEVVLSYLK